jgi:peptide/nickel transport system substrate-binding protein
MLSRRRFILELSSTGTLAVLAACSNPAAPAEQAVSPSKSVAEAPVTLTALPGGQPASGATVAPSGLSRVLRIAIYQEPSILNPLLSGNTVSTMTSRSVVEGLVTTLPDGSLGPQLAREIPTQSNGGVTADGRIVTWKLRPGVVWSDGQPFTSKDVVFTYQVIMDTANPISRAQYAAVDSVDPIDGTTVRVAYKSVYAAYGQNFSAILPQHVFGAATNIDKSSFNRAPLGTGPFRFNNWASGDSISFDRNALFRKPGQPFVDQLIYKITPNTAASIEAFKAGEVDALWSLGMGDIPILRTIADAAFTPAPSPQVEVMVLNTSCTSGPQQGVSGCAHAVLGDVRVRQALELAIDKQAIVDRLLGSQTLVATSIVPIGPWATDLPPSEYNPDKARQLLANAGWQTGHDGIRSKDGVRAHLDYVVLAGDQTREQTQQVIEEQLRAVGIELAIRNAPAGTLSSWANNGAVARGSFDIFELGRGTGVDAQSTLVGEYSSAGIPSEQNQAGTNYTRVIDPEIDRALNASASTLDDAARVAAYRTVATRVDADKANIVLYLRPTIDVLKTYIHGHASPNVWDNFTWDIENWRLDT